MPSLIYHSKQFDKLSVLLTYRSKDMEVQDFIGLITYLISLHNPDIFLGNFNITALKDSSSLEYTLLESVPTHIMGALVDHVYIKNNNFFFDKLTL